MRCLTDGSLGIIRTASIQRCLMRGLESLKSSRVDFKQEEPMGKCSWPARDPPLDETVELVDLIKTAWVCKPKIL